MRTEIGGPSTAVIARSTFLRAREVDVHARFADGKPFDGQFLHPTRQLRLTILSDLSGAFG